MKKKYMVFLVTLFIKVTSGTAFSHNPGIQFYWLEQPLNNDIVNEEQINNFQQTLCKGDRPEINRNSNVSGKYLFCWTDGSKFSDAFQFSMGWIFNLNNMLIGYHKPIIIRERIGCYYQRDSVISWVKVNKIEQSKHREHNQLDLDLLNLTINFKGTSNAGEYRVKEKKRCKFFDTLKEYENHLKKMKFSN